MVRVMDLETCPTELELEWFVGLPATEGDEATRIETHLSRCDRCRERLGSLRTDELLLRECREVIDIAREAAPDVGMGRQSLGHFALLEELGSGGQGVVWKALDRRVGRQVAIKVLRLGHFAPARQRRRLDREIEIVASLRHAGIVTLYESLDLPGDGKAIVMELIDGTPLDAWAAELRSRVSDATHRTRVLATLALACEAMHHAHLRGVIHRDLKPSNILVDANGDPHIVDFGIATAGADAKETLTVEPIGSPPYMAPEQALRPGEGADVRGDVYSLGAIAFEALTGRRAFPERRTMAEFARAADRPEPAPKASPLLRGAPRHADLDAVLATAMAHEPERRYDSALALARDLRALADGGPVLARRDSIGFHLRSLLRQHRRAAFLAAASLAVAATGAAVYLGTSWRHEARQRELVGWGNSLSSLLAGAELDFPDGSIGKQAAIRLDERRVSEAAARLDALLARNELSDAQQVTLSVALARVCYLAGASLDRAEDAASRSLALLRHDPTATAEGIWQCGELLAAIRLRRTNGQGGIPELAALGADLTGDPRTTPELRSRIAERISTMPVLRTIEQVSGTIEELERQIRDAEGK